MLINQLLKERFSIKPLGVDADISRDALFQALKQLSFDLDNEYVLVIGQNNIDFIPKITQGLLNITLKIDPEILDYSWFVIDPINKQVVYIPGA